MKPIKLPEKVNICEVGPRDGLQNEKSIISTDKKVELIDKATEAGYKVIEVGSFVHPKAVPQMADTDEVAKRINKKSDVEYRALVTNIKGIERALKAGITKVKLTISASESHNLSNFNRSVEETLGGFRGSIDLARANNIEVSGAISTSFGCPFEGKIPVERIKMITNTFLNLGVYEISLSDTTGVANPKQVFQMCSDMKNEYSEVKWILHFHNTRGMALANVIAGMQSGITWYDGSFSGLGGCPYAPGASGNLATEDLIHMCKNMDIKTGVNLDAAIDIAIMAKELINHDTDSYVLKAGKISDLIPDKPLGQTKIT